MPARAFITCGLVAVVWDPDGLSVVGIVLTGMGLAIWWSGRPQPEIPRPRRMGMVVAAACAGLLVLATNLGWGVLGRMPDQARAVATVFVAGVALLGTLAIADRSRITFRDALRRRLQASPEQSSHDAARSPQRPF